jgi:hypothetical protein
MVALRRLLFALIAVGFVAAITVAVRSAPVDDPKVNARAREWLERAQTGNVDRSQFTSEMNTAMTDALITSAKAALAPLGTPSAFTLRAHYEIEGNNVYVYRMSFKDSNWNEQIAFASDGKIAGLYFRPAPDPAQTALPGEDPAITAVVRTEYLAWQQGTIERSHYTPAASAEFKDALVAQVATELTAFGTPSAFIFRGKTQPSGGTIYAYLITCPNSDVWMTIGIDAAGKIEGIAFDPE